MKQRKKEEEVDADFLTAPEGNFVSGQATSMPSEFPVKLAMSHHGDLS
jgi:hypothetical protein